MKDRRYFIKKLGLTGVGATYLPSLVMGQSKNTTQKDETVVPPDAAQKAWMDLKFGMFIHFGINTFYDKEWSDGTLDPKSFNPTEINTDQWVATARDAGMKYVVLVAKHHDGFCNWPTAYTDYSVKSAPWNGDLVKMVSDSCKKYNLKFGLYYSLWDRHEKTHETNEYAYVEFMKNQLKELLTNYGDICELWFDGFWKKQQTGWAKKTIDDEVKMEDNEKLRYTDFIQAYRNEGAYRWQMDHLYQHIKQLQSNCLVMNNSTTAYPALPLHPVDIVSGEKATTIKEYQRVYEFAGTKRFYPMQIETTMSQEGRDKFLSGSWFWHKWDHSVASKEKIQEWLNIAEKMNANLLLNVGPMANGKLRPEDVKVLSSLKK